MSDFDLFCTAMLVVFCFLCALICAYRFAHERDRCAKIAEDQCDEPTCCGKVIAEKIRSGA